MERLRLGLFGGTFDPPHLGHLRLARAAREQLALDRVLWVVTADPPHKQGQSLSPAEDRLALVQAMLQGEPGHQVSRLDMDRPGPHWAVDTVRLAGEADPGAELFYLMGGDSLRDLPTWGRPLELLARCRLGVLRRPGAVLDLPDLERQLPGLAARVHFVDVEPLDVASSSLRARLRAGDSAPEAIPPAVRQVILARGLYRP